MLANEDFEIFDEIIKKIKIEKSSLYVLESILRISFKFKENLKNWNYLLIETKERFKGLQNIKEELKGL